MTIGWCRWVTRLLSAAAIHVARTRAGAPWELGAERRPASAHKDGRDWPRVIFPSLIGGLSIVCALKESSALIMEQAFRACLVRLFVRTLVLTRAGYVRPTLCIDLVQDSRATISSFERNGVSLLVVDTVGASALRKAHRKCGLTST